MTWMPLERFPAGRRWGYCVTGLAPNFAAIVEEHPNGYRARMTTRLTKGEPLGWHYTADTLEEAQEWCLIEYVKWRLR